MSNLPLHRTRSGKEFSAFDLALSHAIPPNFHFDIGDSLCLRLAEQEDAVEEEEVVAPPPNHAPVPAPAPTPATAPVPPPPPPSSSSLERSKGKSKTRHEKKRAKTRAMCNNPQLKSVHRKRVEAAKVSALQLDLDATALPPSPPGWAVVPLATTGLGGVSYSQAEVDELSRTQGFMYISWLGLLTIPLLDSHRQVIALLALPSCSKSAARAYTSRRNGYTTVVRRTHSLRSRAADRMEPGQLNNNIANTMLTDELLAHEYFRSLAAFANLLFSLWAPLLFAFYQSIFAACTFNFGPRAICAPHLDFANPSWGWCTITALGDFDPDVGGHLILWDRTSSYVFPPAPLSSSPPPSFATRTSLSGPTNTDSAPNLGRLKKRKSYWANTALPTPRQTSFAVDNDSSKDTDIPLS
ncbi:hypothetical protein DFH09DRAFT_1343350 [Mycena vulgaris]|nr:hypothetical protein DFH09DRAFT_1343350 [Mycena vulgaris]